MKCLIISTNAMGDTYLSASALNVLRAVDRNAQIDFISITKCKPILHSLNMNSIYIIEKTIYHLLVDIIKVRKTNYNYVFSFFPGLTNTFFLLFSKGKMKSGYINLIRRQNWHDRKQKVYTKGVKRQELTWFPTDNYLERVKLALSVFFNFSALSSFQKKIMEISISRPEFSDSVVIHPFSRSKERTIGYPTLKELVKYFQGQNSVLVVGEKGDFIDMANSSIPTLNDLTFKELVEVILSCKLFIAVDSFPIHIADAHNTNFIGIFGPTNPRAVLVNYDKAIKFGTKSLDTVSFELIIKEIEKF